MKKIIYTILIIILITGIVSAMAIGLVACDDDPKPTPVPPEEIIEPINDDYRVFYQVFVGSFSDSNGDGIGDLRGIINRFDYLNDGDPKSKTSLGVQGIWLSPIFISPTYHKYDTSNYYMVDPDFGTEDDLKELIALCKERNVKLILDLVINHTARSHAWFNAFNNAHKNGETSNEYYNFYTYTDKDNMTPGRSWHVIPGCLGEYYEGNFDSAMPELNYDNPLVKEKILEVAKHYLDMGIDGFRFDAIKYIYYNETQRNIDFWKWFMGQLKTFKEDIYCVGECWSGASEIRQYQEALNCFDFQSATAEGYIAGGTLNGLNAYINYIENYQDGLQAANPNGIAMPFIANHDMDRAAGYLTVSTGRAHMGANLLLLGPGSPFIYYGEEIGIKGSRGSANTDANRRLKMLWGDGDTVRNPIGTTYSQSYQTNGTVYEQLQDDDSLLHRYRQLIFLRLKYKEIARGDYNAVLTDSRFAAGFVITYGESTIGLFHNVSNEEVTIDLSACNLNGTTFSIVADYVGRGACTLNGTILTIGPQTSVILR